MTLNTPSVDVTVKEADQFSVTSKNKEMTDRDIKRFEKTYQLIKNYLSTLNSQLLTPESISVEIDSAIPPAIGLASSAAVFSAFAKAISGLSDFGLTDEQISIMARLGSGSAARSIFGGYGAIKNRDDEGIDSAVGYQVADEDHWNLSDIVIAPNLEEKKVGSTEGHAGAWSSPDYAKRVEDINGHRFDECIDAIQNKDFEKLQAVAEEDALNMHHCMQTQDPPLQYLTDETYRILDEVKALREAQHLPVFFTMDGGPTVHLFCEEEARKVVAEFAHNQEGCKVFEATVGPGSHLV